MSARTHPNLNGKRSSDEHRAIWELAAEGRDPGTIAKLFALDEQSTRKIYEWQRQNAIVYNPPQVCRSCRNRC